jgi:hypothetical protein
VQDGRVEPAKLSRRRVNVQRVVVAREAVQVRLEREEVLGWPKRCKLAHAFL